MRLNLTTASDVAEQLHISTQRVYELVRMGAIPRGVVVMVGPRQQRFDQDALRDWIAKGGFAGAPQNEEPKKERPVKSVTRTRKRAQRATA
jgi:excisionase family DNA binding protein